MGIQRISELNLMGCIPSKNPGDKDTGQGLHIGITLGTKEGKKEDKIESQEAGAGYGMDIDPKQKKKEEPKVIEVNEVVTKEVKDEKKIEVMDGGNTIQTTEKKISTTVKKEESHEAHVEYHEEHHEEHHEDVVVKKAEEVHEMPAAGGDDNLEEEAEKWGLGEAKHTSGGIAFTVTSDNPSETFNEFYIGKKGTIGAKGKDSQGNFMLLGRFNNEGNVYMQIRHEKSEAKSFTGIFMENAVSGDWKSKSGTGKFSFTWDCQKCCNGDMILCPNKPDSVEGFAFLKGAYGIYSYSSKGEAGELKFSKADGTDITFPADFSDASMKKVTFDDGEGFFIASQKG
eukprot:TRINITY_DN34_c0_g1_i1.p1 TRINITY_DN34_c0_g1~~TRINITY_DN34_c0_g1_i1.p1  ORF type:complete len:373 (+),score=106.10 TRINITY_DN34_c0_g1_i1:94-1119(+)